MNQRRSAVVLSWWENKRFRYSLFGGVLFIAALLILPGRRPHGEQLAADTCSFARMYVGRPYYWGGENDTGIDCFGLPRKFLILACLKRGVIMLNPSLIREGIDLWWNDQSARSMDHITGDKTTFIGEDKNLNMVDYTLRKPGDLAVTQDGIHMLMYLGNQEWIQADPGAGKVIISHVPSENAWFS